MENNTKPLEVRLNEKQIEVYKAFINISKEVKEVVRKFDGKVLNVKLDRELGNIKPLSNVMEYAHLSTDYDGEKYIELVAVNDYIKTYPGHEYSSVSYVERNRCAYPIKIEDKRINAEETIKEIEETNKHLEKRIDELANANNLYDDMVKDYENIKKMIREYEGKYDYSIRNNHRF